MKIFPLVEKLVHANILLYNIHISDEAMTKKPSWRLNGKHSNAVGQLRYINKIGSVFNITALFKAYRCPLCHQYNKKAGNLEKHFTNWKERVEENFQKSMYQLHGRLFDRLDSLGIFHADNQNQLNNIAISDFESICVEDEDSRDTERTTWTGKHNPFFVVISSNLITEISNHSWCL